MHMIEMAPISQIVTFFSLPVILMLAVRADLNPRVREGLGYHHGRISGPTFVKKLNVDPIFSNN